MAGEPEVQFDRYERRAQRPQSWRRAAKARRVGWVSFALIVIAALAGLFGPGPLSWADRSTSSGLIELQYDRFVRYMGDTTLELRIRPDPAEPRTARVWISNDYLSGLNMEQVLPQPDVWTATNDGVMLTYPVSGPDDRVIVELRAYPDRVGPLRGALGVSVREPIRFWQFVYP